MSLNNLTNIKTTYFLPEDNLVGEVVVPALSNALEYDIMTAFFSSKALAEIAQGLAIFLNSSGGNIRLIISPTLNDADKEAIEKGSKSTPEVLEETFKQYINQSLFEENNITKFTLECLSFLISTERLKVKFAYVIGGDLFHAKVSIIRDGIDSVVIHGSTNFTQKGLSKNYENARIERTWISQSERNVVYEFQSKFERAWFDRENKLKVFSLSEALKNELITTWKPNEKPDYKEIEELLKYKSNKKINGDTRLEKQNDNKFIIPKYLNCWKGEYKHQGIAIDNWEKNNFRGVFEMCTGAGKTIAALVGMHKLFEKTNQLLVYISVPYKPLLWQWISECKMFDLNPLGLSNLSKKQKIDKLNFIVKKLNYGVSNIEVIIGTIDALKDEEFNEILSSVNCKSLLIGDEVHNLGTQAFLNNPPNYFDYRLGLSATFERQYDEIGTKGLLEYFGGIVSSYGLSDAIGNCLVQYDYHVHPVYLTEEEIFKWAQITEKLRKLGWMEYDEDLDDTVVKRLRMQRRTLVEQASNKVDTFKETFLKYSNLDTINYTLIYASDKGRNQLLQINNFLRTECKIKYHQVTAEETSTGLSEIILNSFSTGENLQVLTAMRVLDEGINIPEISTAYLLASTTVKRQWTQRRGRVLRTCDRINKMKSTIHDFIVISPVKEPLFSELQTYEFERIREFAYLSLNPLSETGGLTFLKKHGGYK